MTASVAGRPRLALLLGAASIAVLGAAGCGEKSEPDVHPPVTTAAPAITTAPAPTTTVAPQTTP